jgi:hypothetical protein
MERDAWKGVSDEGELSFLIELARECSNRYHAGESCWDAPLAIIANGWGSFRPTHRDREKTNTLNSPNSNSNSGRKPRHEHYFQLVTDNDGQNLTRFFDQDLVKTAPELSKGAKEKPNDQRRAGMRRQIKILHSGFHHSL